ncbi:MAG TPA: competence/damage-inducible protein A [Solirubrobacteraceae bacterium]|nr:competence/damage-inducible protein A [Solirubrobacteraceae bacterium]
MSDAAVFTGRAAVRAGILVTGTEVLTGIISDRNGPWLSERLLDLGIDVAMIEVVGDRPEDLLTALEQMAAAGVAVIVTSGGLGPTADDLTAEIVGRFCGREMVLDSALEARIGEILKPALERWPDADREALRTANRKQAVIPMGATVLSPRGTAPGLVIPPADGGAGATVVVLPGPPSELQPMWEDAVASEAFQAAIFGATTYQREVMRLFGLPEAEIANTLRAADAAGLTLAPLEITTCLRRGEIEVVTRFEPDAQADYDALLAFIAERHGEKLFSRDGSTIDEQVAALLLGGHETIGVAESCTGGLLAARLTERPGSSEYVIGGAVVYSNEAKSELVGVDPELIAAHGAVSTEIARALADGARARFDTSVGVGITGIAGPGGGTPEKPVGLVCFSVTYGRPVAAEPAVRSLTRSSRLPGDRAAVRDRATTVAMHLITRVLHGESD